MTEKIPPQQQLSKDQTAQDKAGEIAAKAYGMDQTKWGAATIGYRPAAGEQWSVVVFPPKDKSNGQQNPPDANSATE